MNGAELVKAVLGSRPVPIAIAILVLTGAAHAQQTPLPTQGAPGAAPAIQQMPPLTFSKWTKLCEKTPDTRARQMCRTGRDGRLDSGVPLVAAVLIEVEGEIKKVLQVTVPVGVMLPRGTRVMVDEDESSAVVAPFMVCTNSGCLAQIESDVNSVARMKKGKNLYIQAFSMQQSVMTLSVPLADFAQAYNGPPTDAKQLEEQNKKLAEELQKKQQQMQPAAPAKR